MLMPRKARVEFEGACYHVMCRGNHLAPIFMSDEDREIFLETLGEVCERTGWKIHAYVLMGNHYHFLLETPEPNLVAGMQWFQSTYTQRFNVRNKQRGHLFQGRYKALLVDSENEGYFRTVADYIHLNPARARLFDLEKGDISDFPWSSYLYYLRPSKRPSWLEAHRVLESLNFSDDKSGRARFKNHLKKRVLEIRLSDQPWLVDQEWAKIRRGWCFGSADFKASMIEHLDALGGERSSYSGEAIRMRDEYEAQRLLAAGLAILKLSEAELKLFRPSSLEKGLLTWLIRNHTAVPNQWISDRLEMGRADCLSRYPKRIADSQEARVIKLRKRLAQCTKIRE